MESVIRAVEQASVVLMCISESYKDSPNCRTGWYHFVNLLLFVELSTSCLRLINASAWIYAYQIRRFSCFYLSVILFVGLLALLGTANCVLTMESVNFQVLRISVTQYYGNGLYISKIIYTPCLKCI